MMDNECNRCSCLIESLEEKIRFLEDELERANLASQEEIDYLLTQIGGYA